MTATPAGRIGLVVASLVVLVGAFLLLRPDDDSQPAGSDVATTTITTTPIDPAARTNETTEASPPEPRPAPSVPVLTPEDTRTLTFERGERVRFNVRADRADEVHVHGYDITEPVRPGEPARLRFDASIEGIFEIELEESGIPVGELEVRP